MAFQKFPGSICAVNFKAQVRTAVMRYQAEIVKYRDIIGKANIDKID